MEVNGTGRAKYPAMSQITRPGIRAFGRQEGRRGPGHRAKISDQFSGPRLGIKPFTTTLRFNIPGRAPEIPDRGLRLRIAACWFLRERRLIFEGFRVLGRQSVYLERESDEPDSSSALDRSSSPLEPGLSLEKC
ncbi:unnamed protein product [Linum trigynum]|uniref:Uncharacterized protein n=1 Tax=Linum trigynum TaxID=586398 RepID=A0AAV2GMB8_9ROSI